jgi:2-keto-4-pentenoate hydratase/2-oxohepta-3-ene-1,7-dioic acid hydratase in catechol pathway
MKISRVQHRSQARWALLDGEGTTLVPAKTVEELHSWLGNSAVAEARRTRATPGTMPPVSPAKVIGVGLNYRDHAEEVGVALPDHPLLFAKPATSIIGPGAPIRVDRRVTGFPDWEVELAVVVGRRMQRAPVDQALDHVLGYTVANDVTARDIQEADVQWFRSKSLDTFCPLGPWIVTPDEVGDPQKLVLETRVNGEVVQHSSTAEMYFSVAELLAFCSWHFVLEPGDVLLTGTPPGIGLSMSPPRWLTDGDVVEVEVERIGTLANPVEEIAPA